MNVRGSIAARSVLALTLVVLGAISFAHNWAAVRDLSWPPLDIQFRELAAAQTILDQGYGVDPTYLHERVWYNPMSAWLIVGLGKVTGAAAATVVSRAGPLVNLAAPISLFLLVAVLVDGFAAAAAAAAFVFLIGTNFPFYESQTYSPWFGPEPVGQAFLYLSLAAAFRARRRAAPLGWSVLSGALLGLAFLAHTVPAIIGGTTLVGLAIVDSWDPERRRAAATRLGTALASAFVVSLPFAVEILGHYHLRIVNAFPSQPPSGLLDLNELPHTFWLAASVPTIIAAAAFVWRAATRHDAGTRFLLVWLGANVALLVLHVGRLLLARIGIGLPAVVPAFHFFSYLMALMAVGFGVGVRDASAALARRLGRAGRPEGVEAFGGVLTCLVALVFVAAYYPKYAQRVDFTKLRAEAVAMNEQFPADLLAWIRRETSPDDVFLCSDDASLFVVPVAGRKVVATNRYFSNPYVDWAVRDADRQRMFALLERRDLEGFFALARTYRVAYVLVSANRSPFWLRSSGLRASELPRLEPTALAALGPLTMRFRNDRFAVLEVARDGGGE